MPRGVPKVVYRGVSKVVYRGVLTGVVPLRIVLPVGPWVKSTSAHRPTRGSM